MKTKKIISQDIVAITMTIDRMFPELSKYLSEIVISTPRTNDSEVTQKNLLDYYNSLLALLRKYAIGHLKVRSQGTIFNM